MALNSLIQKSTKVARDVAGQALRSGGDVVNRAGGLVSRTRGGGPKDLDDVTITRKVESAIYRVSGIDKGKVSVQTVDGVTELRGTAKNAATIRQIEVAARNVPEVRSVTNLLHQPKTPARTRKTTKANTTTKQREQAKRRTPRSDDHAAAIAGNAEPGPAELAKGKQGRKPAPLGAKDTGGDQSEAQGAGTAKTGTSISDQSESPVAAAVGGRSPA